ncbi:hypothetical protein [Deinococcus sp.]|uniref:hypothetical protein n=1 Tax=Deinococcus sp. TaxID=47478 RepID=UPI003CC5F52E
MTAAGHPIENSFPMGFPLARWPEKNAGFEPVVLEEATVKNIPSTPAETAKNPSVDESSVRQYVARRASIQTDKTLHPLTRGWGDARPLDGVGWARRMWDFAQFKHWTLHAVHLSFSTEMGAALLAMHPAARREQLENLLIDTRPTLTALNLEWAQVRGAHLHGVACTADLPALAQLAEQHGGDLEASVITDLDGMAGVLRYCTKGHKITEHGRPVPREKLEWHSAQCWKDDAALQGGPRVPTWHRYGIPTVAQLARVLDGGKDVVQRYLPSSYMHDWETARDKQTRVRRMKQNARRAERRQDKRRKAAAKKELARQQRRQEAKQEQARPDTLTPVMDALQARFSAQVLTVLVSPTFCIALTPPHRRTRTERRTNAPPGNRESAGSPPHALPVRTHYVSRETVSHGSVLKRTTRRQGHENGRRTTKNPIEIASHFHSIPLLAISFRHPTSAEALAI